MAKNKDAIRVLVVGMDRGTENSIGRKIAKYGVEVVKADGDSGTRFDLHCDAVVLMKFCMSHGKFDQVKEAYKGRGIPMFSVGQGFSEMKEEFESFINQRKEIMRHNLNEQPDRRYIRRETAMGHAFKAAKHEEPVQPGAEPAIPETRMLAGRAVHDVATIAKIEKIVLECMEAGINTRDTIEMLHAEGIKKANGQNFDHQYIASMRSKLKLKGPTARPIPGETSDETKARVPKTYSRKTLTLSEKMDLISRIIGSSIAADRKLLLIEQVKSDEVTGDDGATARRVRQGSDVAIQVVRTSIFAETDTPIITLSRVQAMAIVAAFEKIKEFTMEEIK